MESFDTKLNALTDRPLINKMVHNSSSFFPDRRCGNLDFWNTCQTWRILSSYRKCKWVFCFLYNIILHYIIMVFDYTGWVCFHLAAVLHWCRPAVKVKQVYYFMIYRYGQNQKMFCLQLHQFSMSDVQRSNLYFNKSTI